MSPFLPELCSYTYLTRHTGRQILYIKEVKNTGSDL